MHSVQSKLELSCLKNRDLFRDLGLTVLDSLLGRLPLITNHRKQQ